MSKIKLNMLFVALFFVFTQGMWERVLFFLPEITYVVDVTILVFLLFQFKLNLNVPGAKWFFFFILAAFIVGQVNSDPITETFLYIRFLIYTYLIYNQLFRSKLDAQSWRRILRFVIWMIIIQAFGALYSIIVLGERIEGFVGLMSSSGGTTATVFPLFVSSIALLYYLFCPKLEVRQWIMLILAVFSVVLVGYASGKRGIYFSLPLFFVVTITLSFSTLIRNGHFKKKIAGFAVIAILLAPVLLFGILNSRGLNYSLTGNESFSEVIANSFSYAEEYESATDQYGRTIGRTNTSTQIIDRSLSDSKLFLSGVGYGATKEESTMLRLGYGYGIVGFTRDLISGGWILSLLTVIFLSVIILANRSVKLPVTRIFRRLVFLIFLYIHFFYSADFTVSLKINILLVILLSLMNSPVHRESLLILLQSNKLVK